MAKSTKASLRTIIEKAMASLYLMVAVVTKECGQMVNSMVKGN